MLAQEVHHCECSHCTQNEPHPDRELHHRFNVLLSRMNEQQRRWLVAWESMKIGHGGDRRMAQISGISVETIRRGREELENDLQDRPADRVRLPGGGRLLIEKKRPKSPTG
jgi:hypothetical protein